MSNFLAVATVTATLKELLETEARNDLPGHTLDVSVIRPDNIKDNLEGTRVNIYLYQVTPNAAYRNSDLPTRRADGTVVQRPQAALDLHYMISFYSAVNEYVPQLLLGSVVRTLHSEPQLTRDRIRKTIPTVTADGQSILVDSNLADQIELVKFTPLHLSLEELAKIWSVFYQIPYTLSVAYLASVVLIEDEISTQNALPVLTRNVYVEPFNQPVVERIVAQQAPNQSVGVDKPGIPITLDSTLLIQGHHLQGGGGTFVQIDGMLVQPGNVANANVTDTEIILPLPGTTGTRLQNNANIALVDGLRAGVQGVQVVHHLQMGADQPGDELNWHRGVESNVAPFVLRPKIIKTDATNAGKVTVTVAPVVNRPQRIVLLLNDYSKDPRKPGAPPSRMYSFVAKPGDQTWKDTNGQVVPNDPSKFSDTDSTDTITFAIPGVAPGTYLVRVQVDGAESPLTVDTTQGSPTFNRYISPKVTIQ